MKLTTLLNRSAIVALLLSASVSVFATPPRLLQPDWHPSIVTAGAAVHGKTRAQVRAELLQAEEAGWLPVGKTHYPPSAELMEQNRMRFQHAENWWRAHGQLNASMQ